MFSIKALCPPSATIVLLARLAVRNLAQLGRKQLHTTHPRSLGSSLARLGARQLFPHHHFIPPQFPEEPIGYTARDGFGFYQGGPGSTVGPRGRYELKAKLGCGVTSTVWLARDRGASEEEGRYVTVRILAGYATKLNKDSIGLRELDVVKVLQATESGGGHVARVLEYFFQHGVEKDDGEHLCFVTEFYPNDLDSVWNTFGRKPLPVPVVKRMLSHVADGLAELHGHGIAHTDLRMGSILIKPKSNHWREAGAIDAWYYEKHPPRKCRLVRTPKGMKASWLTQPYLPLHEPLENCTFVLGGLSHVEFVNDIERPEHSILPLRAPELIVGYPEWDQKVDIWSFGLMAFRLLTGSTLIQPTRLPGFPPRANVLESMLYQMMCITGAERFPEHLLRWGLRSDRYFDLSLSSERRGKLLNFEEYEYQGPISKVLREEGTRAGVGFSEVDLEGAADVLTRCLRVDPAERVSAKELVGHPWLH